MSSYLDPFCLILFNYVTVNACFSIGSWNIMHDERSEECIIHEPIEQHELTHLHHGSLIFANKRDLYPIHLVSIKW